MVDRRLLAAALALSVLCTLAAPAWSQVAAAPPTARTTDLDPKPGTAPDPLAPPEIDKPAPSPPGAPARVRETKPADEIDPIVASVRQRLTPLPARAGKGDLEDHAALVEFYASATEPVWIGKNGFSNRATQTIGEIRKAARTVGRCRDQAWLGRPQVRPPCAWRASTRVPCIASSTRSRPSRP